MTRLSKWTELAWRVGCAAMLAAGLGAGGSAGAASINILWYTYADPLSEYRTTGIPGIAAAAAGHPEGSGLQWNVSFFDNASPVPDFSAFNVLVIESGEAFRTNPPGGALVTPDYTAILNNRAAIEAARGERTFISGSDSDFHAIRGDTGHCQPFTGCGFWDGATGYLVNQVNWAASGRGMNVVALVDAGFQPVDERWWADGRSFLHDELSGHVHYLTDNAPIIPATAAGYPLNAGLSSTGLSNWRNSFHAGFDADTPGYTATVFSGVQPGRALSLATTAYVNAATSPVPEPAEQLLWLAGIAVLAAARVRRPLPWGLSPSPATPASGRRATA